ncbi:MAG: S-methyl-5-thioribose-1-phosphate isomerase [Desulfurococcaceae archaeon]
MRYPMIIRSVWFDENTREVCWLNTLKLPFSEEVICSKDPVRVANAIKNMEIRGAPAIGVAAALAIAAYAIELSHKPPDDFYSEINRAIHTLLHTRPTAYNLFYAIARVQRVIEVGIKNNYPIELIVDKTVNEALNIMREDIESNIKIGEYGSQLIPDNATILTHCNAGALATSAYGTALAVIRMAWYSGKKIKVIATETRPLLQGARLTVYELMKEGIPVKLITDNMAGYLMRRKLIDLVIVGADRITKDGYVVNKIGTYMHALAAKRNNIPFYVAAPTSTIDIERTIDQIIIEERDPNEVKYIVDKLITLKEVDAINYAFDITDPDLVTAIITEKGVIRPPYAENIEKLMKTR